MLLNSFSHRRLLLVSTLTLMGVSAAATAGYAWLAGPLLAQLGDLGLGETSPRVLAQTDRLAGFSLVEIALVLIALGLIRTLAETASAFSAARLQLGVVRDMRGKVLRQVLALPEAQRARWPSGELASRVQVEVHGLRALLSLGLTQGIRGLALATALATVALRVDSELATPGLLLLP